ncbi:amidohydrolase family protein [Sphingobium fuliginis]|uniref:Amidohydrolase n=1 Tax=Sphingobium fuliginis ATCC 27551 TaxID=1208342 RepID=A0A5B8CHL9_SPHSA|nr:amidohydrolase family protein [Sphingobium fuliginis]QDC37766.1 amidohydrolase [Sphingobium fuliginis ATCC 27551]
MNTSLVQEEALEPVIPIIDTHHHVWFDSGFPDVPYPPYLMEELTRDTTAGHNIVGTVFAECSAEYRSDGPQHMAPVGETEWVAGLRPRDRGELAGIIAHADLRLGSRIGEVLDAHQEAGGETFKGIRCRAAWDEHFSFPPGKYEIIPGILLTNEASDAMAEIAERDLIFEAWVYHHQLDDFRQLAAKQPNTRFVLEHFGCPLAVGPYAERRDEVLVEWRAGLKRLAELDNVFFKIGGLGLYPAVHPDVAAEPRSSEWQADYWRPEVLFAIETFTPERCVMESDFPVDSPMFTYVTFWNILKRITSQLSERERRLMFHDTAHSLYRLNLPLPT